MEQQTNHPDWPNTNTAQTKPPQEREEDLSATSPYELRPVGPESRTPLLWLIVSLPAQFRGTILPVQPGQVIGRKGEIYWRDPRISRYHARFRLIADPAQGGQRYIIEPYQDRNGTFVNGQPVEHPTLLYENDRVQMGDTLFIVKTLE